MGIGHWLVVDEGDGRSWWRGTKGGEEVVGRGGLRVEAAKGSGAGTSSHWLDACERRGVAAQGKGAGERSGEGKMRVCCAPAIAARNHRNRAAAARNCRAWSSAGMRRRVGNEGFFPCYFSFSTLLFFLDNFQHGEDSKAQCTISAHRTYVCVRRQALVCSSGKIHSDGPSVAPDSFFLVFPFRFFVKKIVKIY